MNFFLKYIFVFLVILRCIPSQAQGCDCTTFPTEQCKITCLAHANEKMLTDIYQLDSTIVRKIIEIPDRVKFTRISDFEQALSKEIFAKLDSEYFEQTRERHNSTNTSYNNYGNGPVQHGDHNIQNNTFYNNSPEKEQQEEDADIKRTHRWLKLTNGLPVVRSELSVSIGISKLNLKVTDEYVSHKIKTLPQPNYVFQYLFYPYYSTGPHANLIYPCNPFLGLAIGYNTTKSALNGIAFDESNWISSEIKIGLDIRFYPDTNFEKKKKPFLSTPVGIAFSFTPYYHYQNNITNYHNYALNESNSNNEVSRIKQPIIGVFAGLKCNFYPREKHIIYTIAASFTYYLQSFFDRNFVDNIQSKPYENLSSHWIYGNITLGISPFK